MDTDVKMMGMALERIHTERLLCTQGYVGLPKRMTARQWEKLQSSQMPCWLGLVSWFRVLLIHTLILGSLRVDVVRLHLAWVW